MEQSLVADGPANTPDNHDQHQDQKPQALPLPPVAQQAYDRYGVLDPVKLDLMIRGIFITREYAATLPSRITPDGCPEPSSLHTSHHSRPPRGATTMRPATAGAGVRHMPREVSSSAAAAAAASSTAGRSGSDVSQAAPSDHEKWGEGEVEIIIRMRAERVGFRYIADRFPSKNQKAVQEKFYKSIKDPRTTRWKRMYHHLRARHDRIHQAQAQDQAQAQAHNNLNCGGGGGGGALEDPIEINSDGSSTIVQHEPIEISSGSVSEATTTVGEEPGVENFENAVEDVSIAA